MDALEDGRKAVKWATDYFIKAHVSPNEFYGQVGKVDHSIWCHPKDIPMHRPAYKIDTTHPGSDLASETAAALAAASIVFQKTDSSYSDILLTHAKQLFDFANKYRGKYTESITDARSSYETYSYRDELVWGATWLYRATGNESYLKTAEQLYKEFDLLYWNTGFTWDIKISGIELADLGASSNFYRQFFKKQIDYILGNSGRSYVVGFGKNPPTHVRHRSSSCPDAPAVCGWDTYWSKEPNYHVLTGALVGGPDSNDNFVDSRLDTVHNIVACDFNAAFQSALAALVDLKL